MQLREELVGMARPQTAPSRSGVTSRFLSIVVIAALISVLSTLILLDSATGNGIGQFTLLIAAGLLIPALRERRTSFTLLVGDNAEASLVSSLIDASIPVVRVPSMAAARAFAQSNVIREIIVTTDSPSTASLLDVRGYAPAIITDTAKIESVLGRIPLEQVNQATLQTRAQRISPFANGLKRLFDLLVGIIIGIIVLPLIPLVIMAIKFDSRGPVLYSQDRIGLNGRPFRIFKFRSMRQDAERAGAQWAQANDPRVTRFGRVMRLTRIDELPQLWNVLRGDMTLVGPRPERPHFTAQLAEKLPGYDARHAVKPGLTGWAQVNYRYASSLHDARIKTEYDLYYVKNSSLVMDFLILLRTIKVVVARQGQ